MMKTRYQTFILRVRLDEKSAQESHGDKISGSLQQVGLPEMLFFDSVEKLHETIHRMVVEFFPKEVKDGNST
jgi:hypothetical protein